MKRKPTWFDKFAGLLLIAGGIGLGGFVLLELKQDERVREEWTKVTAKVVANRSFSQTTARGSYKVKQYTVEYKSNGLTVQAQAKGSAPIGSVVEGYINPKKRSVFRSEERVTTWNAKWFMLGVPLLILAGISVMTMGRKHDVKPA